MHVMKNWQPLVSLPLLAIDKVPGPRCWGGGGGGGAVTANQLNRALDTTP